MKNFSETKKSFFEHAPAIWTEKLGYREQSGENLSRFIREKRIFRHCDQEDPRIQKNRRQVKRVKVENPDAEMARFEEAKGKGIAQLAFCMKKACKEVSEGQCSVFEVHQMMMRTTAKTSPSRVLSKSQGVNAEYAVATTGDNFAADVFCHGR